MAAWRGANPASWALLRAEAAKVADQAESGAISILAGDFLFHGILD
jgi:hypothetical protein